MTITTKNLSKAFLFLTTCAPVLFGAARVVSNAGVIVGCPAQYTTIQAAIAAAAPNDTVYVCNTGVPFNEQVTVSEIDQACWADRSDDPTKPSGGKHDQSDFRQCNRRRYLCDCGDYGRNNLGSDH